MPSKKQVPNILSILQGSDLRSIGHSNDVVSLITGQPEFDDLFRLLFHTDRVVVMRAADAIEKVTIANKNFLQPHKASLFSLYDHAKNIELKWHLALLAPRVLWSEDELGIIWDTLTGWAKNKKESRIVRVNSIQGLYELLSQNPDLRQDFDLTTAELEKEQVPSINARIRILRKGRKAARRG